LYVVSRKLGFFGAATGDTLAGLERKGMTLFSMVFGNAVGLVETRKGKLLRQGEVADEVRAALRSGDILLEKTPFRLTDKLIPGYWGHAAVWVGSEEELKSLGIWDDPVVIPHQAAIRSGRQVVEALRSGVEINPLETFMNIDSLGVMRSPAAAAPARAQIVLQALRQIGKPYDFNFDVESKERVYCSKLVYLAYGDLDWSTQKSLGRTTFTPDDVAVRAVTGGDLELISFYHDGRHVSDRPREVMASLMGIIP
ncbi:MAG: YiiX/YebB-like N1pC/P60 family cysteine hydrolase, partial [Desulfuromonadales bacterium]|nr:YiiX/YebB-like N1pC/P60 family cysteine hydrolase [Desulfuromonadales bacterium]